MMRRSVRTRSAQVIIAATLVALVRATVLAQQTVIAAPAAGVVSPASPTAAQTIDLATALRLAGMNDLDLALIREAENQAKAANDAATLRFFPWLNAGASYVKETGAAQAFGGKVSSVNEQLTQRSVAVNLPLDLGNALFEKLAAQQLRKAAAYDTEAQSNDTLFAAASAYFDLVNAAAGEDIAREAVRISQDYEQQLDRGYRAGLTNRSELLRVSVQTQRDQIVLRQAQAALRTTSAALATLLRMDPTIYLDPAEHIVAPPTSSD